MRVGIGTDVHRLVEGRKLILGGVTIPWPKGLLGHSDADVLLHAVMDAILGALALGDIGWLFPDGDDRWKGACSMDLLEVVSGHMTSAGYRIGNVDVVVMAQSPRLADHIPEMRRNMAGALGTSVERISVKATTTERLGFVGEEKGIAAQAVVLLESFE